MVKSALLCIKSHIRRRIVVKSKCEVIDMTKATKRTAKGVVAGVMVGAAVSAVSMYSMRPKAGRKLRRKAAKALDSVGTVMQNLAEYTK